jgi:hypothetical protein
VCRLVALVAGPMLGAQGWVNREDYESRVNWIFKSQLRLCGLGLVTTFLSFCFLLSFVIFLHRIVRKNE